VAEKASDFAPPKDSRRNDDHSVLSALGGQAVRPPTKVGEAPMAFIIGADTAVHATGMENGQTLPECTRPVGPTCRQRQAATISS
jgi:hypothetical protein